MGKRKDLSEFDMGQIVMARWLGQNISKTAALVGCSRSAVVRRMKVKLSLEEGGLVWWITISFILGGWLCACTSLTWGTHGTKMQYSKKASLWRQCDALGNVLLGNLGSCHPCGCYFDTYYLPKHCCRPCIPFHGNHIPWWLWPLSAG